MNRRRDVGRAMRRVLAICADQAPVLLPAAAVVFVFTAILATALAALSAALTLIAVVLLLAWASSPDNPR
jgi:hypothetical protein